MKIPLAFRKDLKILTFQEENQNFYLFHDELQIASSEIIFNDDIYQICKLLDGKNTFEFISIILNEDFKIDYSALEIANIYNQLESLGYIETKFIQNEKEQISQYLNSPVRPFICAGNSYSQDKITLENEINNILTNGEIENNEELIGLIAPHIDFRLGQITHSVYSPAFNLLKNTNPDLVVILGTAHYKSSDYFMFTNKDYLSPLGVIETDKELLENIKLKLNGKMTFDEMAHYPEHSIEYHVVLLQSVLKDKNVKILPILTGAFFSEIENLILPEKVDEYLNQINAISKAINESGKKVLFLASGDLAHIGRRFNDNFNADTIFDLIENEDKEIVENLFNIDKNQFFTDLAKVNNKRRICGISPFYALLSLCSPKSSKFLSYNLWNDKSSESAVSFCSIAYFK